jgi:hypothetical protein
LISSAILSEIWLGGLFVGLYCYGVFYKRWTFLFLIGGIKHFTPILFDFMNHALVESHTFFVVAETAFYYAWILFVMILIYLRPNALRARSSIKSDIP